MDNCLTLDHEGVMGILPHREPILLVDTVSECVPMDHIEAALYIDPEWDVFRGHFPGAPVFPGVLSVECMAQAADIMLMTAEKYQGKTPLFAGIDKARFLRKISPGDQVTVTLYRPPVNGMGEGEELEVTITLLEDKGETQR